MRTLVFYGVAAVVVMAWASGIVDVGALGQLTRDFGPAF